MKQRRRAKKLSGAERELFEKLSKVLQFLANNPRHRGTKN
jgi:3-hydroxyisobutyrate dehydrogenase-like beta-hydroxyacid dehydrogenase